MDNKGRTYLYTLLIVASVVVAIATVNMVSAGGKDKPDVCDNDGVCEKGESLLTCADCGAVIEGTTNVCQMGWAGINEVSMSSINGNSQVSKCTVGGTCGSGTSYATSCSGLQGEWDSGDSAFYAWYTNSCGCTAKNSCSSNVIDHTGCGWGNKGCGVPDSPGKGVTCYSGGEKVVSPEHLVSGSVVEYYETGTIVPDSCLALFSQGTIKKAAVASTSGVCYYVNQYNTLTTSSSTTTTNPPA